MWSEVKNMDRKALIEFVAPYYADKDIMHNMWHISLVEKMVQTILNLGNYQVDEECLLLATYFHGFIYKDELAIRHWLTQHDYSEKVIAKVIQTAWESQRNEVPATLEGKILHDAHVLEGGKTYLVVKTLITGSVRGQSLEDTLKYMQQNVLEHNKCFLPETKPLCEEMNTFARTFYADLVEGIR